MKVFLDDIREAPSPDWTEVRSYEDCIKLLQSRIVTELSLDHDLGMGSDKTGYDVMLWIESEVFYDTYYEPPKISFHTANPVGRKNMELALHNIQGAIEKRKA